MIGDGQFHETSKPASNDAARPVVRRRRRTRAARLEQTLPSTYTYVQNTDMPTTK